MEPQIPEKLANMIGQDLAGWQIALIHFLELNHDLREQFPAVDDKETVIAVIDKSALEKVWRILERRPAKITSLIAIANLARGIAFPLEQLRTGDAEPVSIFSAKDIEALCQEDPTYREHEPVHPHEPTPDSVFE